MRRSVNPIWWRRIVATIFVRLATCSIFSIGRLIGPLKSDISPNGCPKLDASVCFGHYVRRGTQPKTVRHWLSSGIRMTLASIITPSKTCAQSIGISTQRIGSTEEFPIQILRLAHLIRSIGAKYRTRLFGEEPTINALLINSPPPPSASLRP